LKLHYAFHFSANNKEKPLTNCHGPTQPAYCITANSNSHHYSIP
jgi:hypothetical protein